MIYLYGLADASSKKTSAALQGVPGLQGALEVTEFQNWTLIHSAHDDQEILPKRRLMLTHTRVLEKLLDVGAVLPARFGLVAESLEQAMGLIAGRASIIAQEFDRIRGAVELGLRVRFPKDAALRATIAQDKGLRAQRDALTGRGAHARHAITNFGGQLADRVDRRRADAQSELLRALSAVARDYVLRAPEDDAEVLRAEFLVAVDAQAMFEDTVVSAVRSLTFAPDSEPNIQIIGPVPVYNFVRLNLSLDADEAAA